MSAQLHRTDPQLLLIEDIASFRDDPFGYVMYAFPWGVKGTPLEKKALRTWQKLKLQGIRDKLKGGAVSRGEVIREAVASGHGIGKSALVAMIIKWAFDTWEDTRGVITANTERQLLTKTWPEVTKWHNLSITKHWATITATALYSNDPDHEKNWRIDAVPWSEGNTEAFAGMHNEGGRLLLIFDEASAIGDKVWEVAEGALTDADTEILWLVFGNPTRNTGRFRECFRKERESWDGIHVDSRTVEGINLVEVNAFVARHGVDSDRVKIRVRGMFPAMSAKQFISETDVDAAYDRGLLEHQYNFAPKIITCDPAWSGEDSLEIAMRQGLRFQLLKTIPKNDNDVLVANILAQLEDEHKADAVFIDAGYGTGIVSAGQTMGRDWRLVWFGGGSPDPGYLNMRSWMWGQMRDWLKAGGSIPPDDELRDDLTGPETKPNLAGIIQLESKEDMKKRGLPSPNKADSLALSFAFPVAVKPRLADGTPMHVRNQDSYRDEGASRREDGPYNPLG